MSRRADLMARSVRASMSGRGYDTGAIERMDAVLRHAMGPRIATLDDDHHPAYLHPARSALVLLRDVGRVEPDTLVIAMLHESGDPELAADPGDLPADLLGATAETLDAMPLPGSEDLAERLVALEVSGALAALAERLDHVRHLHLRTELRANWSDTLDEVTAVWLPFAVRMEETLARRYAHWVRTFRRRVGRA